MNFSTRFRYLVLALWLLSTANLFGEIVNGYEGELQDKLTSLQKLKSMLAQEKQIPPADRRRIKAEIKNLQDYISWYELTDALLQQLKVISPDIYRDSDKLRDRKGRPTHIYVKLIPKAREKIQLLASSVLWQAPQDLDMNISKYGECSVSIEIWISDNALMLLSHELGHLNYIIPNLAVYSDFYDKTYSPQSSVTYIGHNRRDQSGKYAENFERRISKDRKNYIRNGGEKPESPLALVNPIRRNIKNRADYQAHFAKRRAEIKGAPLQLVTNHKK